MAVYAFLHQVMDRASQQFVGSIPALRNFDCQLSDSALLSAIADEELYAVEKETRQACMLCGGTCSKYNL